MLLPVIIVGQNLQANASDKRAVQNYEDAEAVLDEALEIQQPCWRRTRRTGS